MKFTKQGQWPYVISGLSSSGAIKLLTLDKEKMANWISGCRVKKYNAPLTTEELEHFHKARWRQEKKKLVAEMAQEEAREWARKCKQQGMVVPLAMGLSKNHKFNIMIDDSKKDKDKTPPPFIAI